MGRPIKKGLDYFPLDVGFFDDDKIAFVSARFQEKGELIAIKLLCKIYKDNGYFYQWGEDEAILFAKRVVGDPSQHALVNDVVHELVKRGFFNKGIFDSFKILTSKGIQERYRKICTDSKRIYEISEKICLIEVENDKKVVSSEKEGVSSEEKPISSVGKYTKESKVKERKEKEISPYIPQGKIEEVSLKYSETGQFTANQEKLSKEIADRLKKLKKSGCTILVKSDTVCIYKTKDIEHAQPLHAQCGSDYNHPLKYIDAGHVNDCGADDTEHFERGYITEE